MLDRLGRQAGFGMQLELEYLVRRRVEQRQVDPAVLEVVLVLTPLVFSTSSLKSAALSLSVVCSARTA
ncbi:hypothetical protein [Kutzneria sp. 744]|uniref:hypothetical protein n=1 Tax=Kutzneria sp. (strain 744) TaxID=345341 RepID=UPI0012F91D7E|nr:hypothetical protein [Kutzneria sp. 744]